MKKILVPCDFSAPAIEALKFAASIAVQTKGELFLIHALEMPVIYDSALASAFEQNFLIEQKGSLTKKLDEVSNKYCQGVRNATSLVEFGSTLTAITRAIDSHGCDLIVIGTHGASGLREYTVGSNTEKVVRNSKVPVIAVKNASSKIDTIVFPTYPDGDQETVTLAVKALQEHFKAKLRVLFVNTPSAFRKSGEINVRLEEFAKRYMLKNYTLDVFNDSTEEEGIINFTRGMTNPMVAMRTHGRMSITHLALGSIAEDVVNHINCPIWTLKIK